MQWKRLELGARDAEGHPRKWPSEERKDEGERDASLVISSAGREGGKHVNWRSSGKSLPTPALLPTHSLSLSLCLSLGERKTGP